MCAGVGGGGASFFDLFPARGPLSRYGLNDDSVIKRMLRHANLKVDPLD